MNSQERFNSNSFQENLEISTQYYLKMISSGRITALKFLEQPANYFMSERKKAKQINQILNNKKSIDVIFKKACDINLIKPNCAFYASFVATFSQEMNPANETIVFFGDAIISASPKKDEIGTLSDHFWTTISGRIFDNSNLGEYSYTNLRPLLKTNNITSGNFQFEEVIQPQIIDAVRVI